MTASLLTSRRTHTAFVAGWTGRLVSMVVVIAIAATLAAGATFAWL